MKRIPLIEHFRNMWVIYYNGPCGGARGGDGAKALGTGGGGRLNFLPLIGRPIAGIF